MKGLQLGVGIIRDGFANILRKQHSLTRYYYQEAIMNYRRVALKDIPGIILLEKKYHKDLISDEDKSGGFITTFFSEKTN